MKAVSLWHNHDYRLLWLGQALSSLGTGISQLAFSLLILALTNSLAAASLALGLGQLPYVLFSLPAGALVDRWDRKRVMVGCAIGLALCLASIPLTLFSGLSSITVLSQIYLVTFLMGTFAVFFELAALGVLTRVVPKAQLTTAVTQHEAVYSSVSLLAPSLSGLLFHLGRVLPFVANLLSYLVLLGSLLRMRTSFQKAHRAAPHRLLADVREGLGWVWSHPMIRFLAFLLGYLAVVMSGSFLLVLAIARQDHLAPALIGVILAAGGGGNVLGTLLCTPLRRRFRLGWMLKWLLILLVLLWPLYGLAGTPLFLGAMVTMSALIDSMINILAASYRLTVVPRELQGRVGSVYRFILFAALSGGPVVIGLCLEGIGVLGTVGMIWSGLLLFTMIILVTPRLRRAAFPQDETPSVSIDACDTSG